MRLGTRAFAAVARLNRHPTTPSARYLARRRAELSPRVSHLLLGTLSPRVRVSHRSIPIAGTDLPARVYQPWPRRPGVLPLVINFHGGGFVFGNLAQLDWLCSRIAAEAQVVVVSVGYRMAPEHPAPGPYEDCWAATNWLIDHAGAIAADPAQVSVMGASAGGNLAALVAIAHRDAIRSGQPLAPLRKQILIYPATDLTLASPSVKEFSRAPILTREIMDWCGALYLPQGLPTSLAFDDPRVSPLWHPDLSEVAPALLIAAGQDPLRDDASRYGVAMDKAGVDNRVLIYPDAIHGFISLPRLDTAAAQAAAEIVAAVA